MALTRISITVPRALAAAADRRARDLERSRSWVVSEALRRYLAAVGRGRHEGAWSTAVPGASPESGAPVMRDVGDYRRGQLEADLGLTPEGRVRQAEETARVGELAGRGHGPRQYVLTFDRYEDYLEWKRSGDLTRW